MTEDGTNITEMRIEIHAQELVASTHFMTVQQQRIQVLETHVSSEINSGDRRNQDNRHGT